MPTIENLSPNDLEFAARLDVGDNGPDAKTAPLRMVARSGEPVILPGVGPVVHDFSGMKHKGRIPVDYNHDRNQVIGYLSHFNSDSGDLECSGALVPGVNSGDMAQEVIHKSRNGVPYEASINFGGGDLRAERVLEGEVAEVNGREFEGPLLIVRNWSLRGVAVCPYGMDSNTVSAAMSEGGTVKLEIEEREMTDEKPAVETEEVVETAPVEDEQQAPADESVEASSEESSEAEAVEEPQTELSIGEQFLAEFGEKGGVWFAKGMSLEDARREFNASLQAEIERLTSENETLRAENTELKSSGSDIEFNARDQKTLSDGSDTATKHGIGKSTGHLADAFARRAAARKGR